MPAPVNYTTSIAASKTVGEMQAMLAQHGAQRIAVDYENGQPSGLTFALMTEHGVRIFSLPVNVEAMHRLLIKKENLGQLRSGTKATRTSREQAERVAWRIMKDWLAAQLALIESSMVDMTQVMLPYLRVDENRTLYMAYREQGLPELEASS
jgi:hypothetical protein